MINVTCSSMPDYEEYIEEIKDLWNSRWLTNMGPKHTKLKDNLRQYLGVHNLDLMTNGHMALELTLQALGLSGEVITTPFTFASTTHAIVRNGLEPVFCDFDPVTFTIDPNKIEELITKKTSAIMPVHVYGNVCNVEAIEDIAKKYNLKVVYDAAHTFGVKYKGRGIAAYGDVSCFSFHATKVFHTIEGGAVCSADDEFLKVVNQIKNFGIKDVETVVYVGTNAKMNEFCAAMGICNLRHIEGEIEKRKTFVERYRMHLGGVFGVQINPIQTDVVSNYAYFPVVFYEDDFGVSRDYVANKLSENSIMARRYFYPITSTFDCFAGKYDPECTPIALDISKKILTLPLYADMNIDDVDKICEIILDCKK